GVVPGREQHTGIGPRRLGGQEPIALRPVDASPEVLAVFRTQRADAGRDREELGNGVSANACAGHWPVRTKMTSMKRQLKEKSKSSTKHPFVPEIGEMPHHICW